MNHLHYLYVTYIATTPETLWSALTNPSPTRLWWVNPGDAHAHEAQSDWKSGSPWKLSSTDGSGQTHIAGKVEETTPPSRLVFSWARPSEEADASKHSRVAFDIEPYGNGLVRLTVSHSELDEAVHAGISGGWPKVLSNLKTFLETGKALAKT